MESHLVDGTWPRGQKLPSERDLARQFNVSRGIIREALRSLQSLGLVEVMPKVGAYHRHPSVDTVARSTEESSNGVPNSALLECFRARQILECGSLELVIAEARSADLLRLEVLMEESSSVTEEPRPARTDRQLHFHLELHRISRNQFITATIDNYMSFLWNHIPFARDLPDRRVQSWNEHRAILDAIHARDLHAAQDAMTAHLHRLSTTLNQDS